MVTTPVQRVDLSPLERSMLAALASCTFLPGSFDKRFVRDISGVTALTEKQRALFYKTFFRYRRHANFDRSFKAQRRHLVGNRAGRRWAGGRGDDKMPGGGICRTV